MDIRRFGPFDLSTGKQKVLVSLRWEICGETLGVSQGLMMLEEYASIMKASRIFLKLFLSRNSSHVTLVVRPAGKIYYIETKIRTYNSIFRNPTEEPRTWDFRLDSKLRLNLTFYDIHFSYIDDSCKRHVFVKTTMQHKESGVLFKFCGQRPLVNLYPEHRFTCVQITKNYRLHTYSRVSFIFTVMDRDIIFSFPVPANLSNVWPVNIVQLSMGATELHFLLRVEEFQVVKLKMTKQTIAQVGIFNGPEYLSEHKRLQEEQIFTGSTFQCLVSVQSTQPQGHQASPFVEFWGQVVENMEQVMLDADEHRHIKVKPAIETPPFNVYNISSGHKLHINISVLEFYVSGPYSPLCTFGGLSLFDDIDGKLKKSHSACHNQEIALFDRKPKQNLYSVNHSVTLVLFSYPEYSYVRVHLKISTTICQPVNINPCMNKTTICLPSDLVCMNLVQKISVQSLKYYKCKHLELTFKLENRQCITFQFSGA